VTGEWGHELMDGSVSETNKHQASSCFQEPAFALTAGLIAARDLAAGLKLGKSRSAS